MSIEGQECVQCGFCCTVGICPYGEWDYVKKQCRFLTEDNRVESMKKSEKNQGVNSPLPLGQAVVHPSGTQEGTLLSKKEEMPVLICLLTNIAYTMTGDAFIVACHTTKHQLKEAGIDGKKIDSFIERIIKSGKDIRSQNIAVRTGFSF